MPGQTPEPIRHLAVAIPAYNEADGIAGFLHELAGALADEANRVTLVAADDMSTDGTVAVVEGLRDLPVNVSVVVDRAERNRGHGPTVVRAYRRCLAEGADVVAQVDGDGQFHPDDFGPLLAAVRGGADVATGRRTDRVDPWFRLVLSRLLELLGRVLLGVGRRDVNCPFRVYDAATLGRLLDRLPPDPLVPHVLLTMLEARTGVVHTEIDVRHRVRRGHDATGTMWQGPRALWRLGRFSARALGEVLAFGVRAGRAESAEPQSDPFRRVPSGHDESG